MQFKVDRRIASLVGKTFLDYGKNGEVGTLKRRLHMIGMHYNKKVELVPIKKR